MKYFLIILTFVIGGLPIYQKIKEEYIKFKAAKSPQKTKSHKVTISESIFLLIILATSVISTIVIQYHEDQKNAQDSINLEKHFHSVVSGLKEDNLELHKTNIKLEQAKDTLRSALDRNSVNIANGITKSGKNLISNIKSTTDDIENKITGGDAFCTGVIINMGDGTYELQFENNFKNAIPSLLIKIGNYTNLEKCAFTVEQENKVYESDCVKANIIQTTPSLYEPNVGHLIQGTESLFNNDNKVRKILIEFISPGYHNRCFEELFYRINQDKGGPYRYRVIRVKDHKIIQLKNFNPNDAELNRLNWDSEFGDRFDFLYKKFNN